MQPSLTKKILILSALTTTILAQTVSQTNTDFNTFLEKNLKNINKILPPPPKLLPQTKQKKQKETLSPFEKINQIILKY